MSCSNSIMLDASFDTLCEVCRLPRFCTMLHQDCPVCVECVKILPEQCLICGNGYNESATENYAISDSYLYKDAHAAHPLFSFLAFNFLDLPFYIEILLFFFED